VENATSKIFYGFLEWEEDYRKNGRPKEWGEEGVNNGKEKEESAKK
jgi:hypothetical protein